MDPSAYDLGFSAPIDPQRSEYDKELADEINQRPKTRTNFGMVP